MTATESPQVRRLAQAVADGTRVDWELAESSAGSQKELVLIRQLRLLAELGEEGRSMGPSWGPLQIREEVGSGSFGTVYRAWDTRLNREVALKILHDDVPALASAIMAEGRLLAQITHPHVVRVYGADTYAGQAGIWMEFIEGRTLRDIVQEGPLGAQEAAIIGVSLCGALAAVTRAGFLHGDVKAQNVVRESGGRIVLMDFGAGGSAQHQAGSGETLRGTPAYLAPELLSGGVPSARSDIYSLGVLLYFMVSGRFPVTGDSLAHLREQHERRVRVPLRDVRADLPASFVRVVEQATAADPAERPATAGALEDLLQATLEVPRPRRRAVTMVAGVVGVMTLAGVVGYVGLRPAPAATPAPKDSVAVLPFRNLSQDPASDYFSMGITDDLSAQLAKIADLRVVSSGSTSRYKGREQSATQIGTELGVSTVLDGSVRMVDGRVRIVSQLLDASTGAQLWSESFDRRVEDIFAVQSEVSRKIAMALRGELSAADARRLALREGRDFETFDLYLKGRYYWGLRTEEGLKRAIDLFGQATLRDPTYAPAFAGLSDAYTLLGVYGAMTRKDAYALAAENATRAIALDPSLAEAYASLGYVRKNRFEWKEAEASFEKAIELKPGYASAHHWYAILLTQQGRFSQAVDQIKTTISLDPVSLSAQAQFGAILIMARRYDEAVTQMKRTLELDGEFASAHRGLAIALTQLEQYEEALAEVSLASERTPLGGERQDIDSDRGYILARMGRRLEATRIAEGLARRQKMNGEPVAGAIAMIYAALDEYDRTFEWLAQAYASGEPDIGYLKVDARWDSVRNDPRFGMLLHDIGLAR